MNPDYNVVKYRVFKDEEKRGIRTNFVFYVPYPLLLDPNQQLLIRLPQNPDKEHVLQVVSRSAYTLNHNHHFFGYDKVEEDAKLKTVLVRNGDRFGITGHSKILISYDRYMEIFNDDGKMDVAKVNKAIEKICEVYNYFLDLYAAVVIHRQVMKISPEDMHSIFINHSDIRGNSFNETKFFTIHGATITDKFVSPPAAVMERLKSLLNSADSNLFKASLGVNAVRLLFSGEYLNGIVQAVTQLESFLYSLFQEKFEKNNINEAARIMNTLGLSNLLELLGLILTDQEMDTITSKIDMQKITRSITIRNKYIHEGANSANIKSIAEAELYINELNSLCVEIAKLIGIDHSLDVEKFGW